MNKTKLIETIERTYSAVDLYALKSEILGYLKEDSKKSGGKK